MNTWVSQVGFNCPKLTLIVHEFGPRNSTYAFWDTTDIYIMRNLDEQPSVGLASLAQLVTLTNEYSSVYIRHFFSIECSKHFRITKALKKPIALVVVHACQVFSILYPVYM